MTGPIGTRWPQAEAEALLPINGVEVSEAPDSAVDPTKPGDQGLTSRTGPNGCSRQPCPPSQVQG